MLFFALMMVILLYGTLFLTNICQQYFFVRFAKMCKKIQSIWTSIRHQIDDLNHPNIHFLVVSEMQQNPTALSALPTNIIFHEIEKKISVKKVYILKSSSLRANAKSKFILNTFLQGKTGIIMKSNLMTKYYYFYFSLIMIANCNFSS